MVWLEDENEQEEIKDIQIGIGGSQGSAQAPTGFGPTPAEIEPPS